MIIEIFEQKDVANWENNDTYRSVSLQNVYTVAVKEIHER